MKWFKWDKERTRSIQFNWFWFQRDVKMHINSKIHILNHIWISWIISSNYICARFSLLKCTWCQSFIYSRSWACWEILDLHLSWARAQKLESSQGRGLNATSLSSSATMSYRQRGLQGHRGVSGSVHLKPDEATGHDCSPFLVLKRLEADPENTELVLGREHLPSGELDWHLDHRSDVFIKLGQQPGLSEPLELERSTDVNNNNNTQLWEVARTDGCCRSQLDLLVDCCHCYLVGTVEFNR